MTQNTQPAPEELGVSINIDQDLIKKRVKEQGIETIEKRMKDLMESAIKAIKEYGEEE